ncbi:MAG: phycobiliprotein lyase [Alkalinema sp. CACIAM 70d]|nr:MAG: phycobiliprotein lyase [Alkalinema sp. CACIAM 70d]
MPVNLTLQRNAVGDDLIAQFFKSSSGQWRSERRYFTLPDGEVQEVESLITVQFLEQGCDELRHLAQLHDLEDVDYMTCGASVTWDSKNSILGKNMSKGSTLFGIADGLMYRDRGFATPKPIVASFFMTNPETLCLRTEYQGSVFEEEVKLIGSKYRTRQTIISRAGEEQMIGQYLEKRVA